MDWKKLLGSITASVDQELQLRNEYLATENRILRHQITERLPLSAGDRQALAEMGQKLGRQALAEIAPIAKPDTILGWRRTRVAQPCDGAKPCQSVGRPCVDQELEALVLRMAQENRS
jgi:putative transposase